VNTPCPAIAKLPGTLRFVIDTQIIIIYEIPVLRYHVKFRDRAHAICHGNAAPAGPRRDGAARAGKVYRVCGVIRPGLDGFVPPQTRYMFVPGKARRSHQPLTCGYRDFWCRRVPWGRGKSGLRGIGPAAIRTSRRSKPSANLRDTPARLSQCHSVSARRERIGGIGLS